MVETTGLMDILAFEDHASEIDGSTRVRPFSDVLNVSNCVNLDYDTFANATPTGFDAISDGTSSKSGGTADEIPYVSGNKMIVTFDLVLNSDELPYVKLTKLLGGGVTTVGGAQASVEGANALTFELDWTGTGVIEVYNLDGDASDFEITNLSIRQTGIGDTTNILDQIPQGAEEAVNGDFASDLSSWSDLDSAWSWSAGTAVCDGTGLCRLIQSTLTSEKYYVLTFDVAAYTSGVVRGHIGSSAGPYVEASAVGTYTIIGRASDAYIYFTYTSSPFIGSIDNVSVKELLVLGDDLVTNGSFTLGADMNTSNCVNLSYDDGVGGGFSNGTPTGFDAVSDGTSFQGCGTADEISYVSGQKYIITFDLVLNSGTIPSFTLRDSLGGGAIHDGGYLSPNQGSNVHEVEVNSTTTGVVFFHNSSQVTNYQITNLSVKDADTNWETGVGVIVANGVANFDGTQTGIVDGSLVQNNILQAGTANLIKYTVTRAAGQIRVRLNGNYANFVSSSGTYEFINYDPAGNRDLQIYADTDFIGSIDNVSVHQLTWGRQITDDSTNYAGFQYALPIDEFDFAIPVDYVAESIVAQQFHNGIATGYGVGINNTARIITGSGFSGKAQGTLGDGNAVLRINSISKTYTQNEYVYIKMKYRTNRSDVAWGNGVSGSNLAVNTGDAIEYSEILQMTSPSGARAFRLQSAATAAVGDYLEIDEFEIRHIIDGEFYEPEAIGGDPVIVLTNYFAENPSRYLTRYFNAVAWKSLILLEADHDLDYNDHNKLMRFTKNS